jgi:josephin
MNSILNYFKTNESSKSFTNERNSQGIYHERQIKELCALHTLNNLFQEHFYTKQTLDELCIEYLCWFKLLIIKFIFWLVYFLNNQRLSPQDLINPHRSIFGRGNYNINIIMKAAQLKGHEVIWFDKRRYCIWMEAQL